MSLRTVATDLSVGPVRIRLEIIPIAVGIGVVSGAALGIAFVLAIAVHELGHLLAARALNLGADKLVLQVTGGGSYIRDAEDPRAKILILLAGPLASLLLAGFALTANALGIGAGMKQLFHASALWTIYQLMPYPPLDGGQLLRIALAHRVHSATFAWRFGWILGLALAVVFVLIDFGNIEPVVLLTGMALILGRAESGYVRHLDAYSAWQRGDHPAVLALVKRAPDYLDREDKTKLFELGLYSAMELGDVAALESIAGELPPYRPVVMAAAEWLLAHNQAYGAKLAQHALDAVDTELFRPAPDDRERYADLSFRYAVHEAKELRHDSALGLLERAIDFGFTHADRLEADGDLAPLRAHPRFLRALERARQHGV